MATPPHTVLTAILDNAAMPHFARNFVIVLTMGFTLFCPGYVRGLAFYDDFAIVDLSQPRRDGAFRDLPLDEELAAKNAEPRCGLQVIDTRTGALTDWIRIKGIITELFDVAVMPGVARPRAIGFKDDEINRVLHLPPEIT